MRLRLAASCPIPPPRLQWDLCDEAGLLTTGLVDLGELGWDGASGDRILLFDAERIPLGDGRFRLQFGLTDASGERTYHRLEEGLRFLVYPGGEMRGPVLIEGSWRMASVEAELGAT